MSALHSNPSEMPVNAVEKNKAIMPTARNLTNQARNYPRLSESTRPPAKETRYLAAKSRGNARKRRGGRVLPRLAPRTSGAGSSRFAVVMREVHEAAGSTGRGCLRLANAIGIAKLLLNRLIVAVLLLR